MVAAAKVVLVEVEIEVELITITTFLSYCTQLGKHLIIEHIFSRSGKEIAPWERENWPELETTVF